MGGTKKISSQQSRENTEIGPGDDAVQRVGEKPEGSDRAGICRKTEMIITSFIGRVIGRQVFLHALLGRDDFANRQPGKVKGALQPKQWYLGGGRFQAAFFSHALYYDYQNLTIVSTGGLTTFDGRKTDLLMELYLERIGVSRTSAAMQWQKSGMPVVLNFTDGPETFSETAFSFDTTQKCDRSGYSYSGCGYLTTINRKAEIPEHRFQPGTMLSDAGGCR
jgi:hypothetical protein